ncbi:SpaH/EbpB family LPXTG-anchored major pilin [Microbacterium yannicii]|uniref:SpaH/EbpB family LPXTG-anchored major pilin n=1 Tax=Microbacterium yannicii TaxID=671622 RepID=UPI0002EB1BF7|nr:SpaH/EbpB family LPXTG-anchored major pilin [Microbacterium yannicii]
MTSTPKGRLGRLIASAGVVALATLGAISIAGPASATDTTGPNIDKNVKGSVTIHKFEQPHPASGLPNNGTLVPQGDITAKGLKPIAGVVFSVTPVTGIDLTTNKGWEDAEKAAKALSQNGTLPGGLGTATNLTATDANGVAVASQLSLGLYLVQEVSGPANIVSPAAPFLVTVPLPNVGEKAGWNYDIHVYPKNAVASAPTKAVDDSKAYALGDQVSWTVSATVPAFAAASDLKSYVLTDTLDARLGYVSATVSLGGTALTSADVTISEAANKVTATFTASGLAKLAAAPGGSVTLVITTKVNEVGDGVIKNTAFVNINGNEYKTNEVQTTWAKLNIVKKDSATKDALAGAVFEVYTSETGGTPLAFAPDSKTAFTTGADGTVTIPGLKTGVTYWLQEKTAPNGYYGIEKRIAVEITKTAGAQVEKVVENTKIPAYALPLTGGDGALMFGIGGGALLLVAAGAAIMITRRRTAPVRA